MIEKLKYDYKLSIPQVDEHLGQMAMNAAPELFAKSGLARAKTSNIDLQLHNSYSTNNWDTVSVCLVSDLNTAIEKQGTYPMSMDYQVEEDSCVYQVTAEFKPWSITPGGDGGNINLKIPFKKLCFKMDGVNFNSEKCEAIIQTHLAFFPMPDDIATPGTYRLVLDTKKSATLPISIIQFNSDLPQFAIAPIVQEILSRWLNSSETLEKIQILFATAQLNMSDTEDFAWLKPTYSSYAYTDIDGDPKKSKFGVLCMVKGRIPPKIHQMPAIELNEKDNFAFMINREIFVEYQLLPSLPQAFENASAGDFVLNTEDGISITAEKLDMPSVTYGVIDYHPKLKKMTITVSETQIICEVDFTTDISPGIVAKTFVRTTHKIKLGYNDQNEPIMVYEEDGEVITRNETEVEAWVIVTEVIAEVITAVVGFAVGKVVSTVIKRVLTAVIVVIICALISLTIHLIIEKVVSEGVQKALPSIQPMATAAVKYVKWPFLSDSKNTDFKISDICLNGTLCFIGGIS